MSATLTIIIPAYNEESSIGRVLEELTRQLAKSNVDADVIVIDDGSSDTTGQVALKTGSRVIRHRSNRGYGAALKTGILAAQTNIVAIVDADGTYPLKYLPDMLTALEHADMVIGARTGTNVHIPLLRRPAKWLLNQLANYVSRCKIPDLNSGMRVFRRDIVVQYFAILPDQFSWTTTITLAMLCDKYAVTFIPIDYRVRTGRSKIVPWDAGTFTILILRMAVLFRPLRVFLPIAVLCLTYGIVKMIVDILFIQDRMISASAILMFMSALVTLLMGMIADAIATRMGRATPNTVAGVQTDQIYEPTLDNAGNRSGNDMSISTPR